jgi:hypothetical protein
MKIVGTCSNVWDKYETLQEIFQRFNRSFDFFRWAFHLFTLAALFLFSSMNVATCGAASTRPLLHVPVVFPCSDSCVSMKGSLT